MVVKKFVKKLSKFLKISWQVSQNLKNWGLWEADYCGFRQVLELLQRPPINRTSKLIDNIIKASETERVKYYIAAGCINNHDLVEKHEQVLARIINYRNTFPKHMQIP